VDVRETALSQDAEAKSAPARTEAFVPSPAPTRAPDREKPRAPKRGPGWFIRIVLVLAVAAALGFALWRTLTPNKPASRRTGQETQRVGAAKVASGDIRVLLSGLGTVTPLATITVQTQINGQLQSVGFKEGQIVQKGDFLAQIDPRPYQAALDQAEGTLAYDQGLLAQAKSDLQRYITLGRQDSIAQQQVADQQFLVQQDEGLVKQEEGAVESAKVNLVYCHIVAPVTGRVGLRLVDPGNYVQTTDTTGLVVLTEIQPISVIFVLPEDALEQVWPEVKAGTELTVEAYDRANSKLIATGKLDSVDNEIDTTTGTVKLRAVFANDDEALYPNQFVNARLIVRTLPKVTTAPVAAIQHGAPGAYVYLIKPDDTVAVQPVTTGAVDGDNVQIASGLKPGDEVVVDGADRLRDGAHVQVVADAADAAATAPAESDQAQGGKGEHAHRHHDSQSGEGAAPQSAK
jgi:membrane fusion protein, multidrug efflux system